MKVSEIFVLCRQEQATASHARRADSKIGKDAVSKSFIIVKTSRGFSAAPIRNDHASFVESEFEFLDHRNVVAMLISMIELIIDRSGTDRMFIDVYSEAGQAVIMFSAVLKGEWAMPDDSLPDAYILFSLLRRHGIEYEFYNTVSEDSPRMICRLFMPCRIARPLLHLRSGKASDSRLAVADFLAYLEG